MLTLQVFFDQRSFSHLSESAVPLLPPVTVYSDSPQAFILGAWCQMCAGGRLWNVRARVWVCVCVWQGFTLACIHFCSLMVWSHQWPLTFGISLTQSEVGVVVQSETSWLWHSASPLSPLSGSTHSVSPSGLKMRVLKSTWQGYGAIVFLSISMSSEFTFTFNVSHPH